METVICEKKLHKAFRLFCLSNSIQSIALLRYFEKKLKSYYNIQAMNYDFYLIFKVFKFAYSFLPYFVEKIICTLSDMKSELDYEG